MRSYVETVLGPQKISDLGRTLTHEHLALDFGKFFVQAPDGLKKFLDKKIQLSNVGILRQYPYSNAYNVAFDDEDAANAVIQDVNLYRRFGGDTIVENTSHGLKRNLSLMKKISEETGVNIIAGTGHYVALTQNEDCLAGSVEQMYNLVTREINEGCIEDPKVKTGFIGEVGSSWPIEDFEKKAIRATGEAQEQLKCPVSFHPGRDPQAPFEIMRLYQEAGGRASNAIMSHLDRTLLKDDEVLDFAEFGSYCQFDLFGIECSYYQLSPGIDMMSDAQRIDKIQLLRDNGKLDKTLMSHDIHTKHRLVEFGGHGYMHIFKNVLPKMKIKGFRQSDIDVITIRNPAEWLSTM